MVSYSSSSPASDSAPDPKTLDLDQSVVRPRSVVVPCFIEVEIMSDDPDHAESCAINLLRTLGPLRIKTALVTIMSVISPLCQAD